MKLRIKEEAREEFKKSFIDELKSIYEYAQISDFEQESIIKMQDKISELNQSACLLSAIFSEDLSNFIEIVEE